MRLVECEVPARGAVKRKKQKVYDIVQEFEDSDMKCAEVVGWNNASTVSLASSLYLVIYRKKFKGISVVQRAGRVFLVRENHGR